MMNSRRAAWGITTLALLAIGLLTLLPQPSPRYAGPSVPWWCVTCGSGGLVDAVLNVLLFVPLGFGLRLSGVSAGRAMALAAASSLGIEVLQVFWVAGRDANIRDLVTNSTGGALGVVLGATWQGLVFPTVGRARLYAGAVATFWVLSRLVTVLLLRPALPGGEWYGQIAPQQVYPADFPGQVLSASVGPHALPSARLADALPYRAVLAERGEFRAEAVPGLATSGLASIAGVLDGRRKEVTLLGQQGTDARFRIRLRADAVGLRAPSLRVRDALSVGDTVQMRGERAAGHLRLTVRRGAVQESASVRLDAGLLWALFLPGDIPADGRWPWFTAIWTASWTALLGFWWGRGALGRHGSLTALLVAGLLLPSSLGGPLPGIPEALGAVIAGLSTSLVSRRDFLLPT